MHAALPLLLLSASWLAASPTTGTGQVCITTAPRVVRMLVLVDCSPSVRIKDLKRAIEELQAEEFHKVTPGCELEYAVGGFYSSRLKKEWSVQACATSEIHWVPQGGPQWTRFNHKDITDQLREIDQACRLNDREIDTPLLPVITHARSLTDVTPGRGEEVRGHLLVLATDTKPECHKEETCGPDSKKGQSQLEEGFLREWGKTTDTYERTYLLKLGSKSGSGVCGEKELYSSMKDGRAPKVLGYDTTTKDAVAQIKTDILKLLGEACGTTRCEECCDGEDDNLNGEVDEGCCCGGRDEGFPEVVAVGEGPRMRCSGSVVDPRAVLTARHCLPADTVVLGESLQGQVQRRRVRSVHVPADARMDVALLELDEPVQVQPRPRRARGDETPPTGVLTHVGFGSREGRYGFGSKHPVVLDAQGWGCTRDRALGLGCDPDRELFVPGSPGRDTCLGDSGGPLYERELAEPLCRDGPGPSQFRTQWRLVGITSRSSAGSRVTCGEGGIYVRADQFAPWLEATLEAMRRSAAERREGP